MNKLGSYQSLARQAANYERVRIKKPDLTWEETKAFLRGCSERSTCGGYVKYEVVRQEIERHRLSEPIEASTTSIEDLLGLSMATYSTPEMLKAALRKPCPYCGVEMQGWEYRPSRDHLVARINGGNLRRGNCIIVCQPCNGDKGSRSLSEWLTFLRDDDDLRAPVINALIMALKAIGIRC